MLNQRGIECDIFESARELKPLGVGINLLPHAVAELDQLGLLDTLAASAIPTSALHYYNRHGQPIWQESRGLAAGYAVPQLSIHRGELQLLLADARSEEHTSELQSLMRISYAVFCLKNKKLNTAI